MLSALVPVSMAVLDQLDGLLQTRIGRVDGSLHARHVLDNLPGIGDLRLAVDDVVEPVGGVRGALDPQAGGKLPLHQLQAVLQLR